MTVTLPTTGAGVRGGLDAARAGTGVGRVLGVVAAAPATPLVVAFTGAGGSGKSAALAELRAAYRAAGVPVRSVRGGAGTGWPEGGTGRVAVLVDDAHQLPDETLDLVLALSEHDDVRLAVAYRPWPRRRALEDLTRELALRSAVVELGPLDRAGVAALASTRLGRAAPVPLVDDVLRLTGGVPRLADLLLADGGESLGPRSTGALPWDLLSRLDADLGPADGPLRTVVLALALGADADVGALVPVVALPPAQVMEALQAARASGLLRPDGTVVPVARQAVLAATSAERTRAVLDASIVGDLARGLPAVEVARRVVGVHLESPELATLLHRAADEVAAADPGHAAGLLAAAVHAGAPHAATTVRRAACEALAGDLDEALRLADDVLTGPVTEATAGAVEVTAAALAHQGLLGRAADLHLWLARHDGRAGPLAPVALLGSGRGEQSAVDGSAVDGAEPGAAPTLAATAEHLLADGMRRSLRGDGTASLAVFAQASAVLRSAALPPLLPDTPAALGALAALSSGEAAHAEWVLGQAVATGEGGPVAQPRHHLLLAWSAMLGGRFDEARGHHAEALASGRALAPRDELVHRALDVGIARRTNDLAALVRAWPGAREALLRHEVDLFMLLPLGELSVAAARLGQSHGLAPQLAAAWDLLDRCGHPVLWSAPMHWYAVHAAVAAERPDGLEPHAAALVQGAQVSRYAALLADAGKAWVQVRAGRVDPAAVQRTGRRLHAAGLGWDASRLAAHAATRTDDQRSASHLMQLARDLHRVTGDRPPDAAPASATPPAHPPAEPAEAAIHLTDRELEVAQLVLAGHTYREISERLYISAKTVEHHVARMRQRLGLDSRAALLAHLRARLTPAPGV